MNSLDKHMSQGVDFFFPVAIAPTRKSGDYVFGFPRPFGRWTDCVSFGGICRLRGIDS